ncbi:methyltransferase domain-containing protein [Scenedesmus sp. NREL 46B-D3]|nr:methyltransferase domain-containing protein [Scenedesmus sp. NREL 46B-D3]
MIKLAQQRKHGSAAVAPAAVAPAAAAVSLLALLLGPMMAAAAWHECNSQGAFPGLYGSQVLANLTVFRSDLLSKVYPSFNTEAESLNGFARFDPVSPFISCPPHRPATSYHRWRLCDLGRLPGGCIVYSVGPVQNDYAFERDIVSFTKCEVHTFDCTTDAKSIKEGRHTHHKLCIGQGKPDHKSWHELVVQLGHHLRGIEAVKIDMEGKDAEVFAQLKHTMLLPRQLAAELHIRPPPPEATVLPAEAARSPAHVALIFSHLAALGYGVTSRSDNRGGQPGCCAEFSWLHVERVWPHGAARSMRTKPGGSGSSSSVTAFAADEAQLKPVKAKRLVVSLSSFPGRAEFAAPTVYSIMHGTRKPDALYLWVTVNVSRFDADDKVVNSVTEIPSEAKALEKQFPGVVKVLAPKKDYGPATKLLPTLEVETDPETIIITVDDDTFYSPTTVIELEDEMLRRPGYTIVRSCEITHWDPDMKKNPPRKGWREWKLTEGLCRGFMTAYASAAYRRGYFDDLVFDQERAPDGCMHHDDIWFSAHLWIRNVSIWVLNHAGKSWPPMYHRPRNRMSISFHPQAEDMAQQCQEYFHWIDDEARRIELRGNRSEYTSPPTL